MQQIINGDLNASFLDYYEYKEILGQGAFAQVVKAIDIETGDEVAVKVLKKKSFKANDLNTLLREAEILQNLNHKNVVKFKNVRLTDTRVLIEMELVRGGQITNLIPQLSEQDKITMMKSIFSALEYIHSKNIVHRDLKPENILVADPTDLSTVKVADFGLSSGHTFMLTAQCGTLIYMAPEQFNSIIYSKSVDVWACAMIMYIVCTNGKHPLYDRNNDTPDTYKIKLSNPQWNFPPNFSEMAKSLFLKCVALEPQQRYTASQVLKHPWITGNNSDEIPMTMYEMYGALAKKESLSKIFNVILLLQYLMKLENKEKLKSAQYINKCNNISNENAKLKKTLHIDEKRYFQDFISASKNVDQIQTHELNKRPSKYELFLKNIKERQLKEISVDIQQDRDLKSSDDDGLIPQSSIQKPLIIEQKSPVLQRNIIVKKLQKQSRKKKQQSSKEKDDFLTQLIESKSKSNNIVEKKSAQLVQSFLKSPLKPPRPLQILNKKVPNDQQSPNNQKQDTYRQISKQLEVQTTNERQTSYFPRAKTSQRKSSDSDNNSESQDKVFQPRYINKKQYHVGQQQLQPTILNLNNSINDQRGVNEQRHLLLDCTDRSAYRIHDLTYLTKKPPLGKKHLSSTYFVNSKR